MIIITGKCSVNVLFVGHLVMSCRTKETVTGAVIASFQAFKSIAIGLEVFGADLNKNWICTENE